MSFLNHLRATIILGIPLVASQIALLLIGVTDTVMVGWLGANELAAGTLSFQFIFILLIFSYGLGAAMMTFAALAIGSNKVIQVRWSFRMGMWVLFFASLLFQVPLFFSGEILLLLGQQESIVALSDSYMIYARWSIIPAFIFVGCRVFLVALERPFDILLIAIFSIFVNIFLNYIFIFGNFGFPRLELLGAGLATLFTNSLMAFVAVIYLYRNKIFQKYNLFHRFFIARWFSAGEIIRLGIPVSFSIFAETGLFMATSLMMGLISTIALAAHGIALQIAGLAFMVPLGLAQAANVRIGRFFGAKSRSDINKAAGAVLLLAVLFSFFIILIFIFVPHILVGIFLDWQNRQSQAILVYAVPLIFVAAAFHLVDSLQVILAAMLRGLKDTKIPLYIAIVSYWIFGVPLAWIFGFWLDFGGIGIWLGLAIGLALAAISLSFRFICREKLGLTNF